MSTTPMLFVPGSPSLFVRGGVTGVLLANAGPDIAFHDTYYVAGHFHHVPPTGAVSGMSAGSHYWLEKMFGRPYSEESAQTHFPPMLAGVNMTLSPMHSLGLAGTPRRIYDHPDAFAG